MIGAHSFSQPYMCISDNFIPPLLVRKIILTIPIKTPFFYISATFHLITIYTKDFFPSTAI